MACKVHYVKVHEQLHLSSLNNSNTKC